MSFSKGYLEYRLKRLFFRNRRAVPIYLFAYHKGGSQFLSRIFRDICWRNNWGFASLFGRAQNVPREPDVIVFNHSLVDLHKVDWPYLGIHIVRDPRDVLVSGYLYHRRCAEAWCTSTDFSTVQPITYPRIPRMVEHRSEQWKADYLHALGEKSYQQNLLGRDHTQGLIFECDRYASWTIDAMRAWDYANPRIKEVKFEDLMTDFDGQFAAIFRHLGFAGSQLDMAMAVAEKDDVSRWSVAKVTSDPHITARQTSRWKEYFDESVNRHFRARFGNVLQVLGYAPATDAEAPRAIGTRKAAGIGLSNAP